MNKLERIACLYLSFLNFSSGLSFARLRRLMPSAYDGDFESARRKFERDKEELKKLGLELKYYSHHGDYGKRQNYHQEKEHVYVPNEEIQRIPDIDLSEADYRNLAALILDAITKSDYNSREDQVLYSAANKLFYKNPALVLEENQKNGSKLRRASLWTKWKKSLAKSSDTEQFLESVHHALKNHKPLKIRYSNRKEVQEERMLSGRGLISHKGRWCLVAYCHRSKEIRYFYIDRILSAEICEGRYYPDLKFDIRKHSLHPFSLKIHPLKNVDLKLRPEYEENFSHFLDGALGTLPAYSFQDGIFRFQTSNQTALFTWMLRNPNAIEKIGPSQIQKEYCDYLEKIKSSYRD